MDVARLAGVSKATASLALNGKRVGEATRARVIACAKKLSYVPNRIGRTLSTGKSGTIQLLVVNSVKYINFFREISFFYHIVEGLLTAAESREYSLHFDVKNWEDETLAEYIDMKARDRSIDGMIIVPQFIRHYGFLSVLRKRGLPYVILDPCIGDEDINSVRMDNFYGGKLVADLFISHGFVDLALVNGPRDHYDGSERERGFKDALAEQGLRLTKNMVYFGDFSMMSGYRGMEAILLAGRPRAVFCANDYMAAGALRCLNLHGFKVPEDTALVGYDNTEVASTLFPQLTTVDNKMYELGKALAEELFAVIGGNRPTEGWVLQPELIVRETCPYPG